MSRLADTLVAELLLHGKEKESRPITGSKSGLKQVKQVIQLLEWIEENKKKNKKDEKKDEKKNFNVVQAFMLTIMVFPIASMLYIMMLAYMWHSVLTMIK